MFKKLILVACVAGLIALAGAAGAHDYRLGDLEIRHPWARASIGAAKAGAAYVVISNQGREPDRLVAVATVVAAKAALHLQQMKDGVMRMRPVAAIEIAPGEPAVLAPGGLHIMLMGLKAPLIAGTRFALTLIFEKAGSIDVQVEVQKATDMAPAEGRNSGS